MNLMTCPEGHEVHFEYEPDIDSNSIFCFKNKCEHFKITAPSSVTKYAHICAWNAMVSAINSEQNYGYTEEEQEEHLRIQKEWRRRKTGGGYESYESNVSDC